MLIEFRVGNFRSFREEQTFSLVASRDEKHPESLIPAQGFSLLKSAAIYGANASGKSNLVKAIDRSRNFILTSATTMNQGDKIPGIAHFGLDAALRAKPSRFEFTLLLDNTRYQYGFTATSERIEEEWLYAWPRQRKQVWLERRLDADRGETEWIFRGPLKGAEEMLSQRTRDNGLALSRAAELNIKPLSNIFLWFRRDLLVLDLSRDPVSLAVDTARHANKNPQFQQRVVQMLESADLSIDQVLILEEPVPEGVAQNVGAYFAALGALNGGSSRFQVGPTMLGLRTLHRQPDSDTVLELDFEEESNGTQRFFALTGPLLDALEKGAAVVVDELDCSMHPLLTRKLIELFQSPQVNKKGAQLIFATHDSTLMDPELFRRDQIWIVEKGTNGASELFSLYDFNTDERPRNTEAFQRNYLAGRYGGVPNFGPIFEDLVLE